MKKLIIISVVLIISSFTVQLFAQETAIQKTKTKSNNTNERAITANQVDCVVKIKSTDNGISIVFDHAIVSPRDAASGLPTGKRMHKPVSFYISPSDNTIVEVSSTSNMVSGQASVIKATTTSPPDVSNAPGNPIKGLSVKGGRNPGGNQLNKIVVTDGEFTLPANLEDGEYEMSISFTYQKIEYDYKEKANSKSFVSGRFILDIDGGVCRSIKEKGVTVRSTK